MKVIEWSTEVDAADQLEDVLRETREIGVVIVEVAGQTTGGSLTWEEIRPWTRTRAVTVADVTGDLAGAGIDVALCCDLIYLREGSALILPGGEEAPTAGQTWALARAGRSALALGLLTGGRIDESQALRTGLVHELVPIGASLPLPERLSLAALTAVRDLMRARVTGEPGRALELATFRLLFAAGDPKEGARAFFEKRRPRFAGSGG